MNTLLFKHLSLLLYRNPTSDVNTHNVAIFLKPKVFKNVQGSQYNIEKIYYISVMLLKSMYLIMPLGQSINSIIRNLIL